MSHTRPALLPSFAFTLVLSTALSALPSAAQAATLYKCTNNGEVTYANEPCKGQKMEVVKGKDTNMVHVNESKSTSTSTAAGTGAGIGDGGSATPDIPVVKLQPKTDSSMGDAANLGLGAAAPAGAGKGQTNERFLQQLQAQTQALAQQNQAGEEMLAGDNEGEWPAALRRPEDGAAAGQAPAGFEPLVMPTGAEIVTELRKAWLAELLPTLKLWLSYALLLGLLAGALGLLTLYWVMRLAVKHGMIAAQNTGPRRVQLPPLAKPMPKVTGN